MDEEKQEIIYDKIMEASILTYALKRALDHQEQPNKDTTPFSQVAGMIEVRLSTAIEYL